MRARSLFLVPLTVVITAGGLFWGGKHAYIAARNRAPVEMTCADYIAHPPDTEWVRLTHCDGDLDHLGIETTKRGAGYESEVDAVYVPLRAEHAPHSAPAALVLEAEHAPFTALRTADEHAFAAAQEELSGPIEGLIELSVDRSERSRDDLRGLDIHIAKQFAVLAYHAAPRPLWLAFGVLALGLGGLTLIIRRVRPWFRKKEPGVPRATALS